MMVGYVQVMFSILTSNMVDQLILTSPYAALLNLLLYPPLLPGLEWLLQLEKWLKMRSTNLAAVEKVGSDFIPLVVKCFGVWTPFALKTCIQLLIVLPLAVGFLVILQGKITSNTFLLHYG